MTRKKRRLTMIGAALCVVGAAVGVSLYALRDSIVFFYGPTEFAQKNPAPGTRLRIGGLVETGTFKREGNQTVVFSVTDTKHDIKVTYTGLLPDLFREGQGAVVEGTVEPNGIFKADNVLAKHDERYMPKEVADALKKQGVWKEGDAMPASGPATTKPAAGGVDKGPADKRASANP